MDGQIKLIPGYCDGQLHTVQVSEPGMIKRGELFLPGETIQRRLSKKFQSESTSSPTSPARISQPIKPEDLFDWAEGMIILGISTVTCALHQQVVVPGR
ncbi:hypothetical protein RRG08_057024 [Elysia crispata]|uniref:Uncharacterized protein n=1 Tax=Elysia crispata TaxID=231223 RepID=A0AAE0Z7R5_9GAST|nr:hypothetical protein RRG08_057024 [Elysia crispata]